MTLAAVIEALLFLSPEPVGAEALADACEIEPDAARRALEQLRDSYVEHGRGLVLRELAGGWVLSSSPEADDAARRLLTKPRTPPLSAAQAETLAIVAYLQPVSRPEIARIRGVNAESATQTLLERGLIEEAGRSQFGASLYRSTDLFLKLFGLESLEDLVDVGAFDPSPEVAEALRERLLRAGEQRLGDPRPVQDELPIPDAGATDATGLPGGDATSPGATDATGLPGGDATSPGATDATSATGATSTAATDATREIESPS